MLLLLLCGVSFATKAQLTFNGVTLPAKITFQNQELLLNGGGIRSKLFFMLYTAGLYLTEKHSNAQKILAADKMMAVRFEITSGMINSDNMSEAINEGFDKSTDGNTAPIRERIDALLKTFSAEEIVPGDLFEVVYIPGKGTDIYKNQVLKSTHKGMDFKKALFGIWISDNPVSSSLRKGMLNE
jgi:hypothetical protein